MIMPIKPQIFIVKTTPKTVLEDYMKLMHLPGKCLNLI